MSPIQSAAVSSKACLSLAATLPASAISNPRWGANGWDSSIRLHRTSPRSHSCPIQRRPRKREAICPRLRPLPGHSDCSRSPPQVHDTAEIERAIAALGRDPGGGLVMLSDGFTLAHRELIVRLADKYRVPAVYPFREFAKSGGLLSYGVDMASQFGQAAPYVDRILKGAKPGDLPVQAPTKFELIVNLKTAKALGLDVPEGVLGIADEVIE